MTRELGSELEFEFESKAQEEEKEEGAPDAPPPTTIVDCDVLEAAKENVQPLGTGRRVTALSTILKTPHVRVKRDARFVGVRERLRRDVEVALECECECECECESGSGSACGCGSEGEGEGDALEAYTRLVSWTLENYPQGPSVESGLLELLEEATRVLMHRRRGVYKSDKRYLKLWLLYAGFVERPTVVYWFLVRNEVGTGWAMLYEEWAAVLERDGRRKEADEVYALGVARRAEPVERLRARYGEFQKRMMTSVGGGSAESGPTPRVVLGSSSSSRRTVVPSPAPSSALKVFVDPTGTESRASSSVNTWTDIGTRKTRVKENVQETKKLVGTTVRRTGARIATTAGRIPVFRDPLPGEAADPGVKRIVPFRDEEVGTPVGKTVTRLGRLVGSVSEMEALRKDPLKNYDC